MLLLDTDTVPVAQRVELFRHVHNTTSVPIRITHEVPPDGLRAYVEAWEIDDITMFTSMNTGFQLTRTKRHIRQETRPVIGIALQNGGVGRSEVYGEQQLVGVDDVYVCNEMVPYEYGWSGEGSAQALLIDLDRLGISLDCVKKATPRLPASPLYPIVHQHLLGLWRDPGAIEADPGVAAVAQATVELVRAMLVSAAEDERSLLSRSVMDETLLTRVRTFVQQRLADPELGPRMIAWHHGISVRSLYGLFHRSGSSLEQWIIAERLKRAHEDLASPQCDGLTIEAVARRWGFAQASHFSRRFREHYGVSPSQWRRLARTARP